MEKPSKNTQRFVEILAFVTVVAMLTNFVLGLPIMFTAGVAIMSVITAVGIAYIRRPFWVICMYTFIASANVLIGMGLTFPVLIEMVW